VSKQKSTYVGPWKRPVAQFRRDYVETLPSLTDQSQGPMTDVNNIMDRYAKTGQIMHLRGKQGQYMDLSATPDLMEAFAMVDFANKAFMDLPADLRRQLDNDPRKLEGFVNDPKNQELLVKYGLLTKSESSNLDSESTKVPAEKAAPKKPKTPVAPPETET
jgi:hypothetical protein